jgi:penicillin amidase
MAQPQAGWRRRAKKIAGVALGLLVAAALAVAWRVTRFPVTTGTVAVQGIDGPIEILRGPYGVPHVFAKTARDAWFGLGFCEAQDRTFQLEVFRRAESGTLAEILGDGGLDLDQFTRTIGIRKIAERQVGNSSPEARVLSEGFVAGVNAGFHSLRATPPEFALLGIQPGDWTLLDVVAFGRLVSFGLAHDHMRAQVLFSKIVAKIGEQKASLLLPLCPKPGRDDRACLTPTPVLDGAERLFGELGIGTGCSNWIVAGSRTASGKPLFAYDSHQGGARFPGEVYLAHLMGGELDVAGGVIVGTPGIYCGATRTTAFASTNCGADAIDLETVEVDPSHPESYTACGKTFPFTTREETISVKGRAEPVKLTVRETVLGPLVSNVVGLAGDAAGPGRAIALDWAGARPELRMDGYVLLPTAKDWPSFRKCLEAFEGSAQHFGFAQADGTIAYQVIGPIPRREKPAAPWPAPPQTLEHPPLLTLDELPHLVEPTDGFIVTANQKPIHSDEPWYIGRSFIPSARHDRLCELVEGEKKADIAFIKDKSALDLVSPAARHLAPVLSRLLKESSTPEASYLGEKLGGWNGEMRGAAVEPLLYHAFVRELTRALLEDELGPELLREYATRPDVSQERLAAIFEDPSSPFWDDVRTDVREDRSAIVKRAAKAAVDLLEGKLGKDRARWRWDALHTVTLEGYLHGVTTLFDAGPYGVPGDEDTPYRFGWKTLHEPFKADTVALLRMFVDLSDPSAFEAIVSSGEQAWPFHPHSKDQIPLWLEGRTIRIPRDPEVIRSTCPERLVLEPRP